MPFGWPYFWFLLWAALGWTVAFLQNDDEVTSWGVAAAWSAVIALVVANIVNPVYLLVPP